MIKQLKENVWQITCKNFGSHVYLIKLKAKDILIDTDAKENRYELISELKKLGVETDDVSIVILTHNHPDHVENFSLFKNAKIYGSKLDFLQKNVINIDKLKIPELKILKTSGHSPGGICILYNDVLFSGDTLFHRGTLGRTDLPGSDDIDMKKSLKKIKKLKFKILAPGHGSESLY
jgi:glyoxylase-like metal-dependent hydrolase (beta-lactamase superfamily II)